MHYIRCSRNAGDIPKSELKGGIASVVKSAGRRDFRGLLWKRIISKQLLAGEEWIRGISNLFHVWLEMQSVYRESYVSGSSQLVLYGGLNSN